MTCKKVSKIPKFWILEVVPRNFLPPVRQKTSNEERDFPFSCIEKFGTRRFSDVRSRYPRNFSVLWGQKNQSRIAIPATEHKSLRCPKDSETKRDSLPSFVGSIREKNSTEKSDITLLGMKFLESRTFLIYWSVPQRNFSALWAKKNSTENRDIPFSFKIFFVTSHLKFFETLDGSSRSFSVLWDKKNWRKTVIRMKVSGIPSFLKLRSGSQDFFANCETKFFDWRTWFSVLRHGKFRYPKISGRLKSLPTKFFSTVRPKKSTENRDTALLNIKFFDVSKILDHRGVPSQLYRQ